MSGYFGPEGGLGGGPEGFGGGSFDEFLARFFGSGGQRHPARRVDITLLMSEQARELMARAARKTADWGRADVDTEHLLWAATQVAPTRELLEEAGADPGALASAVEEHGPASGEPREAPPTLAPAAKRALLDAHQLSRATGASYIGPEHLLLALAANPESNAGRLLTAAHVTPNALRSAFSGRGAPPERAQQTSTPTVDQYGRDLTAAAREAKLDPVIGRDGEIEQTIEVLSRRTKNNPVLIGDAGVGKTAIVEGLAQRIVDADVPDLLLDKRVIQLDITGVVAGTRYRGDFEERMKKLIDEIREHGDDLIIFIDELHTVVGAGAGAEGTMDAGNMLKPSLARGEMRVVGATTLDEYRRNIEKDAALERRFQPILVPEPTLEDTIAILRGLRDRYEAHHQVRFRDEALVAAAELSDRYVTDRFLPDKAIDLVDQAGARVRLRLRTPNAQLRELEQQLEQVRRDKAQAVADEQYEHASRLRDRSEELRDRIESMREDGTPRSPEVTTNDIAEVVSRSTGIPVSQLTEEERSRLLRLEDHLHHRVIGQDEAVRAVAEAVRRSRAGLGDPNRPMGSFLFLGPTGVGKTELAKALAEALFGDEDRMVRMDMSEFQERHTVSRLTGAPPGYVGYEEAGQLTETVRRHPYSVLLFDEIEKAHSDVFNMLLQVLDDGRLTDGQGRTVDFRNTVVIMTSNVGSDLVTRGAGRLGFNPGSAAGADRESERVEARLMSRLRETFRPEFLNRIDEVIVFRQLDFAQLREVTDLMLEDTRRRLRAQDVSIRFEPAAVQWVAEHGHQPEFGARPMRRTIQREIDNQLSAMLLDGQLTPGHEVTVDARDDHLYFAVDGGEGGVREQPQPA
ncbi:ATP-dependent Clp protease ATP-binding subunit [Actinoalloteichus sp. AHMU CJ021]|uniref:ATP-dependent Clp protease ATP-binding subunit n=1 Tax=Actinoalloteichus TaxID=65496 RepID=UPI000423291D|nr:ATP-dependent Clp protease ATP-binding subunit [Actinoalloteichus caeruleus]AUS80374.1 ATP-dependent Clp protease ATP-binding subunit [Actinoalloteichus sp. AHMU CJ021]